MGTQNGCYEDIIPPGLAFFLYSARPKSTEKISSDKEEVSKAMSLWMRDP